MKPIQFVIGENNTYYKLEPGKALIEFSEFDFTFFWEQCISAGKTAHKTGRLPSDTVQAAKNAIQKCHPYVEAAIKGSFDGIVADCIIAYICSSEHVGLEELWARCISPKNQYESALFRRISEYKTGRAINQWINIVRMKEYAKKKLDFIFDDRAGSNIPEEMRRHRKEYFDLAFSLAANDLGYPVGEMPYVRRYSPSLAPEAAFRMGKLSHFVYHSISEELKSAVRSSSKHVESYTADQAAMDAFSYIKEMPRPDTADMNRAVMGAVQSDVTIYMPVGFKGIIDLEFDLLEENGEYIERCASCGRYFIHDNEYGKPYCDRVNTNGRTCRAAYEEQLRLKREEEEQLLAAKKKADEKRRAERRAFMEQKARERIVIPPELEKRADDIRAKLSAQAGKGLDRLEFEEWARYLENLKGNVRRGDGTFEQLDEFLNSADKMYGSILNGSYAEESRKGKQQKKKRRKKEAPPSRTEEQPVITSDYSIKRVKKSVKKEDVIDYIPVSFDDYAAEAETAEKKTETGTAKEQAESAVQEKFPQKAARVRRPVRSEEPPAAIPDEKPMRAEEAEEAEKYENKTVNRESDRYDTSEDTDEYDSYENRYDDDDYEYEEYEEYEEAEIYEEPKVYGRRNDFEEAVITDEVPAYKKDPEPEVHYTEDGRKYTPFMPKKYSSVSEAMSDTDYNKGNSPALKDIIGITELAAMKRDNYATRYEAEQAEISPESAKKNAPTRVIRKPDWEVMSPNGKNTRRS